MQKSIITIGVKSIEQSIKFYQDILNFKIDNRFKPTENVELVFLSDENGLIIELLYNSEMPIPDNSKSSITLTFQFDDLDVRNEHLTKMGIEFKQMAIPSGMRFSRFSDPNGVAISFVG